MEGSKRRKVERKDKYRSTSCSRIITRSISREQYRSAVNVIVKDIMDDILGKLALKELVRLKCVCKAWYNSITRIAKSIHGPRKIMVAPSSRRSILIVDHEAAAAEASNTETTKRKVQRTFLPLNAPGVIAGSSNGLLLIVFERSKKRFVLWNPLIKEYKIIPNLQHSQKMLDFNYFELIGFGHDGCSDDYKIVRFLAYQDSSFEVLVYSLKTNSWRNLKLEQPFSSNNIYVVLKSTPRMGTLVNGALYWPVSDFDGNRFQILRFHLADEKFNRIQAPDDVHRQCDLRLMVFEGNKLCAYQKAFRINMWVSNENQETESKWTHLMSIPLRISKITNKSEKNLAPLSFMRDGEALLCNNQPSGIEGCCLYNPKNRTLKWLGNLGIEGCFFYEQVTYEESIESLVPYNGIRELR